MSGNHIAGGNAIAPLTFGDLGSAEKYCNTHRCPACFVHPYPAERDGTLVAVCQQCGQAMIAGGAVYERNAAEADFNALRMAHRAENRSKSADELLAELGF